MYTLRPEQSSRAAGDMMMQSDGENINNRNFLNVIASIQSLVGVGSARQVHAGLDVRVS